ncbi:hypothetical protein ACHAXH_004874 [Discostella pseudostelligera]
MDRPLTAGRRYNHDGRSRSRSRERHRGDHSRDGGGRGYRGPLRERSRDRDRGHASANDGPRRMSREDGRRVNNRDGDRWDEGRGNHQQQQQRHRGDSSEDNSNRRMMNENDGGGWGGRQDSFGERDEFARHGGGGGGHNTHRHHQRGSGSGGSGGGGHHHHHHHRQQHQARTDAPSHLPVRHHYQINPNAKLDENLQTISEPTPPNEDPRGNDPMKRITAKAKNRGNGMNTESFDPASTLVRPDLRVWVGSKEKDQFDKPLKHDDVVMVPELFGPESDWSLYYTLISELRSLQKENVRDAEWISWHEGAHLISKAPHGSPTFEKVVNRICEYFKIQKSSIGTRFNWYRDSTDWKPFHHDSAAFNPKRAKTQNITVGVSFGATRELAFLRASSLENGDKVKIYFPQTNNGVFSFGRDVNILFKHGINALPEEEQDGKGRISIILWGLAEGVKEEDGSPPLLGSDGQGPHAQRRNGTHGKHHGDRRR